MNQSKLRWQSAELQFDDSAASNFGGRLIV
jgi:hypothetical protein